MTNEELVDRIKNGIDTSENTLALWQQTNKFITLISRKYTAFAEIEDLEQEGYLALTHAVETYKESECIPFINYLSQWLHQTMRRYIENTGSIVRIPVHEQQRQREYKKFVNEFCSCYGRKPTRQEIAHQMGVSVKRTVQLEKSIDIKRTGSLDSSLADDDDCTVGDMIPGSDNVEQVVLDRMEQEELKTTLWSVVDSLPGTEPEVLRLRYQQGKTLKETGEVLEKSIERIRTIEEKAKRDIRTTNRAKRLYPFLPEAVKCAAYRHNGVSEFNRTWTSSTELAAIKLYEEIQRMKL